MKLLRLIALLLLPTVCFAQGTASGTGKITGVGTISITPFPTVQVSPTSLNFGSITQGSSSASQVITVRNTGSTTLAITSIAITTQYSYTTTCTSTLIGGATCTVNVVFSPTGTGTIPGTLTVNDNAQVSPQTVSLTGIGVAQSPPVATLTPGNLAFGNQTQGTSSASQGISLQNTGGAALSITSIIASAQYSQTNNCPASLSVSASCTVNVIFSPTGTGSISGSVTFTDNATGSPQTVSLSGTGVAPTAGPLTQSGVNSHYFVTPGGKPVYLIGSHTWDDFDDTSTAASPAAFPFSTFASMLKNNGHTVTILWHKDLPRECSWQNGANYNLTPQPWPRTGPGNASDGLLKFDLSQFNQAFFDRMRSEALTLQSNGIYAIVELFDGNNLTSTRCGTNTSPNGDGFPLTGANNINGINDGYTGSGSCGVQAFTMATNNAVTGIQDAYVKKTIDTLNDIPTIIWEVAEEQPGTSFSSCSGGYGGASTMTFWAPHMMGLVRAYEGGGTFEGTTYTAKPFKHPVGIGSMNFNDRLSPQGDTVLYGSIADWIGPTVTASAPDTFPSNVAINNQSKLVINDSDHALGYTAFVNTSTGAIDDVHLRDYIWENFTNGAAGQVFMDPYVISLPVNQRNPCTGPVSGVCASAMTKYDPFRAAMGFVPKLMGQITNLLLMTTQNALSSTGFALANNSATSGEFVVYSPTGGTFTVNLSAQANRNLNVQWLNPVSGALTNVGTVVGGNAAQSFTTPWGATNDSVLHLTDAGGAFPVGWNELPGTNFRSICPSTSTFTGIGGSESCKAVTDDWSGGWADTKRQRLEWWGGGHAGYYGNEVYFLDLRSQTIGRYTDPAANPASQCSGTPLQNLVWQNTTPNVPHGYGGQAYLGDNIDKMFYTMGDMSRGTNNCQSGAVNSTLGIRADSWTFNLSSINQATLPAPAGSWTPLDASLGGAGVGHVIATGCVGSCTNPIPGNFGGFVGGSGVGEFASIQNDSRTNTVYIWDGVSIYSWNPATPTVENELAQGGNAQWFDGHANGSFIDVDAGTFVLYGNSGIRRFHIDTTTGSKWATDNLDSSTTGCSVRGGGLSIGADYDFDQHIAVLWGASGQDTQIIQLFNPKDTPVTVSYSALGLSNHVVNALTCETYTPPLAGTTNKPSLVPTQSGGTGEWGRFRYFHGVAGQNLFATINNADTNGFVLALNPPVSQVGSTTFATRCAAAGVVRCVGFDANTDIVQNLDASGNGLLPDGNNTFQGSIDPAVKASGAGSLLFNVPASSGQNTSGEERQSMGASFGPPGSAATLGTTFYVQFRYRMDANYAALWKTWAANGEGQKIFAVYNNNNSGTTCQAESIVFQNIFYRGFPQAGTNCVNIGLYEGASPNIKYENGSDFQCLQNQAFTEPACDMMTFHPNEWYTFYCKFILPQWDANAGAAWNSGHNTIQCWTAREGQPMKQFLNFTAFPLQFQNSLASSGYNYVKFFPYDTSRTGGSTCGPANTLPCSAGKVWYDELIVSTQPIPAPDGPTPVN